MQPRSQQHMRKSPYPLKKPERSPPQALLLLIAPQDVEGNYTSVKLVSPREKVSTPELSIKSEPSVGTGSQQQGSSLGQQAPTPPLLNYTDIIRVFPRGTDSTPGPVGTGSQQQTPTPPAPLHDNYVVLKIHRPTKTASTLEPSPVLQQPTELLPPSIEIEPVGTGSQRPMEQQQSSSLLEEPTSPQLRSPSVAFQATSVIKTNIIRKKTVRTLEPSPATELQPPPKKIEPTGTGSQRPKHQIGQEPTVPQLKLQVRPSSWLQAPTPPQLQPPSVLLRRMTLLPPQLPLPSLAPPDSKQANAVPGPVTHICGPDFFLHYQNILILDPPPFQGQAHVWNTIKGPKPYYRIGVDDKLLSLKSGSKEWKDVKVKKVRCPICQELKIIFTKYGDSP